MSSPIPQKSKTQRFRRAVHAQLRDTLVLLQESGRSLLLFALLVAGVGWLFYAFYVDPHSGEKVGLAEAMYGAFTLVFFQDTLAFPRQFFLQILYFIVPIVGLVMVADSVIRFGVALTNKQERGQKWQIAMASTYNKHVIICGIGKVGYRVALELLKFGREVVAIESNPEGRFVEKVQALGIPIILADGRRQENLVKAGVHKANAIIPCTDDELTNLDIALDARELNPDIKIVLRMFDPDLARRIETGFGIHTAFSVSALAAPVFAAASMHVNVRSSFYVGEQLLHIGEFSISPGSGLAGWTVRELEGKFDLSVVSLIQGEQCILHPEAEKHLSPGDKALLLASLDILHKVEEVNRS